jgi:hypothetical protein
MKSLKTRSYIGLALNQVYYRKLIISAVTSTVRAFYFVGL